MSGPKGSGFFLLQYFISCINTAQATDCVISEACGTARAGRSHLCPYLQHSPFLSDWPMQGLPSISKVNAVNFLEFLIVFPIARNWILYRSSWKKHNWMKLFVDVHVMYVCIRMVTMCNYYLSIDYLSYRQYIYVSSKKLPLSKITKQSLVGNWEQQCSQLDLPVRPTKGHSALTALADLKMLKLTFKWAFKVVSHIIAFLPICQYPSF